MPSGDKTRDLTEQKLISGWASVPKIRIRQATGEDTDALARVAATAEVPFEQPMKDALEEGIAGAGLRAGLRAGPDEYWRHMARRLSEEGRTNPMKAYLDSALLLVADHQQDGVVGGLIAYPPVNVAEQVADRQHLAGAPQGEVKKTIAATCMFLTRIKAVAVDEDARLGGVGASLLERCKQIYDYCRYRIIYGAMPDKPGLDRFYRRAGFTVQDHGEPLDLYVLYGVATFVSADIGERIFVRHHMDQ